MQQCKDYDEDRAEYLVVSLHELKIQPERVMSIPFMEKSVYSSQSSNAIGKISADWAFHNSMGIRRLINYKTSLSGG
jgi:hypothetical protein